MAWTPVAAWRDAAHCLPKGGSGGGTAHLPLPLLLLLLLSLCLLSLCPPSLVLSVSGAACPSGTYNDGFAYVKDGGGFNIADPGFILTGRSFTMEVWLKRDQNAFMCWMAQGSPGTLDQLLAFCSDSKVEQHKSDTQHTTLSWQKAERVVAQFIDFSLPHVTVFVFLFLLLSSFSFNSLNGAVTLRAPSASPTPTRGTMSR